jgi:3',5'-cyclic-AMP phosphodiesterase
MPIHLSPGNRRAFLQTLGTGAAAFAAPAMAATLDENLVYLLNDTHIGEKHPTNSAVPSNFREVVNQLIGLKRQPAAVLINGDLALKDGQPGDYRHFAKLIQPLRTARLNLHLTLGNHDHRDTFYQVLSKERRAEPPVVARHASVVKTRHANFFLLDSLTKTMVTQGEVGTDQLAWLTKALDAHPDKPAIIITHHNPRLGGDPIHFPGGLIDSEKLWDELAPRRQVKAYVHGHIHHWSRAKHRGIHIINTPATSYVGNKSLSTTGWTTARLRPEGVTLRITTNDRKHRWNGDTADLKWRT